MNVRSSSGVDTLPEVFYQELALADVIFSVTTVPVDVDYDVVRLLRSVLVNYELVTLESVSDVVSAIGGLVDLRRSEIATSLREAGIQAFVDGAPRDEIAEMLLSQSQVAARLSPLSIHDLSDLLSFALKSGETFFANRDLQAMVVAKAAGTWVIIQCARGFGEGLKNKSQQLVEALLDVPLNRMRNKLHLPSSEVDIFDTRDRENDEN